MVSVVLINDLLVALQTPLVDASNTIFVYQVYNAPIWCHQAGKVFQYDTDGKYIAKTSAMHMLPSNLYALIFMLHMGLSDIQQCEIIAFCIVFVHVLFYY